MDEKLIIFVIAFIILVYGFFSKKLETYNISGPMIFLIIGIFLSPLGLGLSTIDIDSNIVKTIAEIALVIVLFTDSSSINLKVFKKEWSIAARLLFVGLPLTIIFSSFSATLFFPSEPFINLLLMALILAPTDAALGKAVVSDKNVPERVRDNINVESGLNDGIVFPLLITVILLMVGKQELGANYAWFPYLLQQILLGFIFGALSGFIGAKSLGLAIKKGWVEDTYKNLSPVALAILSFYIAEYLGGNGFIAAFISGLFFGNFSTILDSERKDFLESEGEILILMSFLVFGIAYIPATIEFWNLNVVIYSILSLTLFRMIPVAISLIGLKLSLFSNLFIGWFGPRGIASILYVMIVAQKIDVIEGHETLFGVISLTILLSIILHGLSASPLASLYKNRKL